MNKIIPIRLSHSTLETFNRCERYFELEKLLANEASAEESADLSLGKGYGAGVADYLVHQDQDKALFTGWMEYWPELETEKKNVPILMNALIASFPHLDNLLRDYEVVYFKGKPAIELSFRININESFFYVGYIDVVLRNRFDGVCVVVDAKTTSSNLLDLSALYSNSSQVLGYSIALDKIVGEQLSSYATGYFVAQMKKDMQVSIQSLIFHKTLLDRLNWFITLGQDIQRLETCRDTEFYPRRGSACVKFNRTCKHYGTCTLTGYPKKILEEDDTEYDFVFELDDLINDHLRRIQE